MYNIGVAMHDIVFAAKLYERMDKEKLVDIDLCQARKEILGLRFSDPGRLPGDFFIYMGIR